MDVRYKIRAAFKKDVKNIHCAQSAGHSFWQLIKEIPNLTTQSSEIVVQETLYAFPISKEVEKSASMKSPPIHIKTSIAGFPKKWRIYCFDHTVNHSYHFLPKADATYSVCEDLCETNEAQRRWGAGKASLYEKIELPIKSPNSITLSHTIRNMVYAKLAKKMRIKAHPFPDLFPIYFPSPLVTTPQSDLSSTAFVHYKIKAAVVHTSVTLGPWKIYSFPMRVGHHFLVLTATHSGQETMLDSIHGLSNRFEVDRYGNISSRIPHSIGSQGSRLKVLGIAPDASNSIPHEALTLSWIEPEKTHTVYEAKDTLDRWNQAKRLLGKLNDAEMPYSFCGFGKSIGFFKCKNSNSAYTTVLHLLGFEPHKFEGYFSPGSKTPMLPKKDIDELKRKDTIDAVCSMR